MKDVMLLGSSLQIGGAERVIANLAQHLNPVRFAVTVCHLKERGVIGEELASRGCNVVAIPRGCGRFSSYFTFVRLATVIRSRSIRLVHTHTTYALTAACLCKIFCVWRLKVIHTFHFGNYPHYPLRYRQIECVMARIANRLIAVGDRQRSQVRKTYFLPSGRITTIVNGVNEPLANVDPEWAARLVRCGKVVVGSICTFIEQKGLPDLIEVARQVCASSDNAIFLMVGDGPLREEIMQKCSDLGLSDRILFSGWKPNAGATMLPLFDVLVQSSHWEAMSMVVLEAMAAGKPVAVTDVGDNGAVVVQGITGYVVPPGDVAAMSVAVGNLVGSPARRKSFGAAARKRFVERYTVEMMAVAYETIYADCIEGAIHSCSP